MYQIVKRRTGGLPYELLVCWIFKRKGIDFSHVAKEHFSLVVIGKKTLQKMMLRISPDGWMNTKDEVVIVGHGDDKIAKELLKEDSLNSLF